MEVIVEKLVRNVFNDLLPAVFPLNLPRLAMERLHPPVWDGVFFQTYLFYQKRDGHNVKMVFGLLFEDNGRRMVRAAQLS